jgi:hypothetical protein
MRRATVLFLAIGVFLSGCVTYRGTITGVAVRQDTKQAMPFLEVYHYVRRKTNWPEKTSKILVMEAQQTTRSGDFKFGPAWCWHIPFFQEIDQERVIVNLALTPQLLARSFETGIHMNSWIDPLYVQNPDPRYMGVVIDIKGSLLWPATEPTEPLPRVRPDHSFSRGITNKRDLGHIMITARSAPKKPAAPLPPKAATMIFKPAAALPAPQSPASVPAPLEFETLVPAGTP